MASEMNSMYSKKQCDLFVIDQYKFRFHKYSKNNIERWCCCKKTCKSYIHLNSDNDVVKKVINYNHHEENEILNRQILSNKLKRKAVDDISEKPSKIINSELLKNDIDTLTTYDLQLIRKYIYIFNIFYTCTITNAIINIKSKNNIFNLPVVVIM